MFKIKFSILVMILICLSSFAESSEKQINAKKETVTVLAEDDYYPYSHKNKNGGAEGITVDIIRTAFEEAGAQVVFIPTHFERAMRKVKDGVAICCFNTPFEKRIEDDYLWSENKLYVSETWFFAGEIFKGTINEIKDLEGKRLGLTLGYGYGDKINNNNKIEKSWVKSDEINMKKLVAGRIDIVAQNPYIAMRLISKIGADGRVKSVGKVPSKRHMHLVFSKLHPEGQKWCDIFDKGMGKIIKNKTYEKIFSAWEEKIKADARVK